jgi:ubiquinone/menaquinone biosynthesis C-methylase UbiE
VSVLAPGVPADYYDSIYAVELGHWWHRGMRRITAALLGDRLTASDRRLLDVGCGTGGFLGYAHDVGSPARLCGVDISTVAIELARTRVPQAELHVGPAWDTGFDGEAFDLIVINDVLQHLPADRVAETIAELHRCSAPGGALLVRTNGARRERVERDDWRAYDRRALVRTLEEGGFRVERVSYVNLIPSLFALARGNAPHAPTEERHGVARGLPPRIVSTVAFSLLAGEARYLRSARPRSLPYGHTLLALATRA